MHTVLQGGIFLSLTKQWEVEEVFTFPLELGCVKEEKKINVQVNWNFILGLADVHEADELNRCLS